MFSSSFRVREMWLATLSVVLMLVSNAGLGQSVDAQEKTPAEEWLEELLAAFNSNDSKSIPEFAQRSRERADFLNNLKLEFGPLTFKQEFQGAYWCQGNVTKGWVGFVVDQASEDRRFYIRGVRRGISPPGVHDDLKPESNLAGYLENYLNACEKAEHFSGTVLVSKNGKTIFSDAFGYADRENEIENTVNSKVWLASTAKLFSAVAIGLLVDEGKLQFDDPIGKWIPEYPKVIGDSVTIHHLLTHTSGIELDHRRDFMNEMATTKTLDELLAVHVKYIDHLRNFDGRNYAPLDEFDYTNESLDLLGIIIQRASGKDWQRFMAEHVFKVCEMENTGIARIDEPVDGLAKCYALNNSQTAVPATNNGRIEVAAESRVGSPVAGPARPAGSIYSTAEDMNRLATAIRSGNLVSEQVWKKIATPHVDIFAPGPAKRQCGYLFQFSTRDRIKTIGHTGGAPGMSSIFEIYPEQGYVVAVLSNYDRSAARNVSEHIKSLIAAEQMN